MEHGKNICPRCGGELQTGYARTGQKIAWKKHEDYGLNIPEKENGEFYLRGSTFWNGSACPGFYCPVCEFILLPQKEEDET